MATKEFALTSLELACGVTIEDVQREVPRLMLRDNGATLIMDGTVSPALGSALVRFVFGDREVLPPAFNYELGLVIYRLA